MFRRFLFFVFSFGFALQVLVLVGCSGSRSMTTAGSGGGASPSPSPAPNPTPNNDAVCGGFESGYNNRNGSVTGIWLQTPAPGENPGHVQVNATVYATSPIKQWTVCLDDKAAYQTNSDATSISQGIDMTAGQHLLWATVSDVQGDSERSEIRLIQVGPPPPSSTVIPTPPANAQVLSQMQNNTGTWSICSECAAGTNDTNDYWMEPFQKQPSLSGSSLEMYANGPAWSNVLFKDIIPGTYNQTHFIWDFWVYHDPTVEAHFWSSELDFYVVLSGKEFMIGTQCDFGDGYWATWDSNGERWLLNGIPCPHWAPGWHHVQWYLERTSPTQYRYDTLVFDGQGYGLNQTWTFNPTGWVDQLGIQYQLDEDPTSAPLHEWVDNVTVTMW